MPNICITERHIDSMYYIIRQFINLHEHDALHRDDLACAKDVLNKLNKVTKGKNYFIKNR